MSFIFGLEVFSIRTSPSTTKTFLFNPLPDDKFEALPNWKSLQIAISNLTKMVESYPSGKKTLWEKEKLLVTSNFSFSHSVFKSLVSQGRQKVSLCGNGLNLGFFRPLENVFWKPRGGKRKKKTFSRSTFSERNCTFWGKLKMSSVIALNLDKAIICRLVKG